MAQQHGSQSSQVASATKLLNDFIDKVRCNFSWISEWFWIKSGKTEMILFKECWGQHALEEGQRTYWPKDSKWSNKNEDNSLNKS